MSYLKKIQAVLLSLLLLTAMFACSDDDSGGTSSAAASSDPAADGGTIAKDLKTVVLPGNYTVNLPVSMRNATPTGSAKNVRSYKHVKSFRKTKAPDTTLAQTAYSSMKSDMDFFFQSAAIIGVEIQIFDTLLYTATNSLVWNESAGRYDTINGSYLQPSDTVYPGKDIELTPDLKAKIESAFSAATGGSVSGVTHYRVGPWQYRAITDPMYDREFQHTVGTYGSDNYERLTVRWKVPANGVLLMPSNVWVKREIKDPEVGHQAITFTYEYKSGEYQVGNIAMYDAGQREGLSSPVKSYSTVNILRKETGDNDLFYNMTSSNFLDDGDFFKFDLKGMTSSLNGGFIEAEYAGPVEWGQGADYQLHREAIRFGFDVNGTITQSGAYKEAYGTASGWVDDTTQSDFTPTGTPFTAFRDQLPGYMPTLVNATAIKEAFPADNKVKYLAKVAGAVQGDLYYVFSQKLDTYEAVKVIQEDGTPVSVFHQFQPALDYLNQSPTSTALDPTNSSVSLDPQPVGDAEVKSKFIGIMTGIASGEVSMSVVSAGNFNTAGGLYIYKYNTAQPRRFELVGVADKECSVFDSVVHYNINNGSRGGVPLPQRAAGGMVTVAGNNWHGISGTLRGALISSEIRQRFIGWDTDKNAAVPRYKAGDTLSIDKPTTLYAIYTRGDSLIRKVGPYGGYIFDIVNGDAHSFFGLWVALEAAPKTAEVSKNWADAKSYADNLQISYPGEGWKLPGEDELQKMAEVLHSRKWGADNPLYGDDRIGGFENGIYWSSADWAGTSIGVDFSTGEKTNDIAQTAVHFARPIRPVPLGSTAEQPDQPIVLNLIYDSNGGTAGAVPVDSNAYNPQDTVTVSGNTGNLSGTLVGGDHAGYGIRQRFVGWNTKADGSGTNYTPGQTFTITPDIDDPTAPIRLYAIYTTGTDVLGKIGPGGGYVFYYDQADAYPWRYLEVVNEFQMNVSAPWGDEGTLIGGAVLEAGIGKGQAATTAIVTHMNAKGIGDTAAQLCDRFSYTYAGTNFSDWFLPSHDEVNLIYQNLYQQSLGGFPTNNAGLLSSSEFTQTWRPGHWAYRHSFSNNDRNADYKNTPYPVRAIRVFPFVPPVTQAEKPVFSPEPGHYNATNRTGLITITTATPGASIRYTLDGSNPTATHGTLYSGPINPVGLFGYVSGKFVLNIKAIAYLDGADNSEVVQGTFAVAPAKDTFFSSNGDGLDYNHTVRDSNGKIHIAYRNRKDWAVHHLTDASGSWVDTKVSAGSGSHLYPDIPFGIAVDGNGKVHIVFTKNGGYSYTGKIYYATDSGGSWTITSEDEIDSGTAYDCALAVDSSGKAHIIYMPTENVLYSNKTVKYAHNSSGSWVNEDVYTVKGNYQKPKMIIDSGNKIHLAFSDSTNVLYLSGSAGSWTAPETIDSALFAWISDMAFDTSGKLHIAYSHSYGLNRPQSYTKVANNKSGTWSVEQIDVYYRGVPTIAFDSNGKMHIAYNRAQPGAPGWLYYANNVSGSWKTYELMQDSSSPGMYPKIFIDSDGRIKIYHGSWSNGSLNIFSW